MRRIKIKNLPKGMVVSKEEMKSVLGGSRTNVNGPNDRYINMETSYLLQRVEDHKNMAILTSNLKYPE